MTRVSQMLRSSRDRVVSSLLVPAVEQAILPSLKGFRERFDTRLDRLLRESKRLESRIECIERMELDRLPFHSLAASVWSRFSQLSDDEGVELLNELMAGIPDRAAARYYGSFDRVGKLDYERHPIFLRHTSAIMSVRLESCQKEPFTVAWIEENVRAGDVFFDIGANVGPYSLVAAKYGQGACSVYAFEPAASSFVDLCRNVFLNGCQETVIPMPMALWSTTGFVTLSYRNLDSGTGKHRMAEAPAGGRKKYPMRVLAYALDDLIERFGLPSPNLIKLDVDGPELSVLRGAERALRDERLRSVIVELNEGHESDIVAFLSGLGLALLQTDRRNHEGSPPYGIFTRCADSGVSSK